MKSGMQKRWKMSKIFNTSAVCRPEIHYMVDLSDRLEQIKKMVDRGDYFTINRARQFGKTTLLPAEGVRQFSGRKLCGGEPGFPDDEPERL